MPTQPLDFWSAFGKAFWDLRQLWLYLLGFAVVIFTVSSLLQRIFRSWRVRRIKTSNVRQIMRLSGEDFETFLAQLYRNRGFLVEMTPRTGDYGVDLILTDPKTGQRIAVQAKRYSGSVGIPAVQEVYFGMAYHKCHRAIVVTTADFTPNAIKGAEAVGVGLIDGTTLTKIINQSYAPTARQTA